MAELTQAEVVYSPRSVQVWRTLLNWLAFFFQIFVQILRAVGHHPLLSSSSSSSPSSSDGFKPLPMVELSEAESPATLDITDGRCSDVGDEDRIEKLTVLISFSLLPFQINEKPKTKRISLGLWIGV